MVHMARNMRVPPNSASLAEAKKRTLEFFRMCCRSIPEIMEIYNLYDVVSPSQLRSAVAAEVRKNSNVTNPKTSSIEIERVCDGADESVLETAAVSAAPPNGGPEQLAIFVVVKEGMNISPDTLKKRFSRAIQSNLNPLFKVRWVKIVGMLPRTASNKLLRRVLREQWKQHVQIQSKL